TTAAKRRAAAAGLMTWDEAVSFALSLPGTELALYYGQPAVKVAENGRALLMRSHETATSFALALDLDSIELLKETDPATYWQTAHYEGWPAVLVRYDSPDDERVRAMIERSRAWSAALPKARPRKRK
ncbi:MAG: hypothetical protein ABIO80_02700, partial [Sphingomicrobium sp.]